MSDKEILKLTASKYAKNLGKNLLHINSLAGQAAINYVIGNIYEKYSTIIDMFVDKNGNINIDILGNALKEEIKDRDGIKINIFGNYLVFSENDVTEFINMFKQFKKSDD